MFNALLKGFLITRRNACRRGLSPLDDVVSLAPEVCCQLPWNNSSLCCCHAQNTPWKNRQHEPTKDRETELTNRQVTAMPGQPQRLEVDVKPLEIGWGKENIAIFNLLEGQPESYFIWNQSSEGRSQPPHRAGCTVTTLSFSLSDSGQLINYWGCLGFQLFTKYREVREASHCLHHPVLQEEDQRQRVSIISFVCGPNLFNWHLLSTCYVPGTTLSTDKHSSLMEHVL